MLMISFPFGARKRADLTRQPVYLGDVLKYIVENDGIEEATVLERVRKTAFVDPHPFPASHFRHCLVWFDPSTDKSA